MSQETFYKDERRLAVKKLKNLAESIILQSIEDLWSENERKDCIKFFKGEGFGICAKMAGMKLSDEKRVRNIVNGIIDEIAKREKVRTRASATLPKQRAERKLTESQRQVVLEDMPVSMQKNFFVGKLLTESQRQERQKMPAWR